MFVTPRNISILLLSITAFSAVSAQAADVPLRGPIPFESFDKDGDKMISPQEFVETHNQRKKMRTDANMPTGRMPADPAFTSFDADGDNLISAEELETARATRRQQRGGMPPGMQPGMQRQGMPPGMHRGMGRGMQQGRNRPGFADFDLDADGALSKEEFNQERDKRMRQRAAQGYPMRNAASAPTFESIDTDGDGKVTPEELAAHQASRRQMRRGP